MHPIRQSHPLHRFFRGLVENVFAAELGICNPEIVEYLAHLLTEFIHVDRLHAVRDAEGRPLSQVADMLTLVVATEASDLSTAERRGLVYRHIGDYTLFWIGVYPEALRARAMAQARDRLLDYVQQGKRSYAIASELIHDDSVPPPALLRQLSDHFESCAHGLELVRREWEHDPSQSSGPQVALWY
jgi:hypothetical protein